MSGWADARFERLADPEALARRAAEWLLELAIACKGKFNIALSGGATPKRLYRLLAEPPFLEQFPWGRVHWFFGDERFVPHTDALSNFRMVHEALFTRAPVPEANIHPIPTEGLTSEESAAEYDFHLRSFIRRGRPLFDAVLLGLGTDGHTASLFPGSPTLDQHYHFVTTDTLSKPEARITLTFPALESTRNAAFLIAGADKRTVLAEIQRGGSLAPAARLHPVGTLWLFADAAACEAHQPA